MMRVNLLLRLRKLKGSPYFVIGKMQIDLKMGVLTCLDCNLKIRLKCFQRTP